MQLSAHQFEQMRTRGAAGFPDRVAQYIRQHHADAIVRFPRQNLAVKDLSPKILEVLIAVALQRGRALGLSWQSSLNAFATLMFVVAPNFDQHPEVAAILGQHNPDPPDLRMKALPRQIRSDAWRQAAAGYDPYAWRPGAETTRDAG